MNISFIGLGNMGLPMAANLLKAGHDVLGFDLVPAALQAHAKAGGRVAASVAEAVRAADIVITMLPAGKHVAEVVLDGILPNATDTPLLIDSSTIDVETARRVAAAAAKAGLDMLDAPVSGGVGGATAGTLTFMVGGPDAAFARALPVLQAMGRNIVHTGPAGAGQAAKICNNMILGISMLGVSEAFVLADKLGLDRAKLFQVSSTSSGQCWALTSYCPVPGPVPASPANRAYAAGFAAALMLKDLQLSQAAAEAVGAATPLGAHAARLYQAVAEAGESGRDFSVVFPWLSGLSRKEAV
ncbi:3-hydroxyisobutyrate dehydrogenase [Limobrevibacterium gyesilva]|uniref:3-hydroxyisobutyrate dehydrogenase n=1 Tax=Limobrevibacterium gyesilva TaxID=2991712 RepID=A0AA41YXG6_9PROT|nr:3-hydroxyisobutyrate dehydrogenase [Limobrevibacterium gyesilva]MCW3477117.1 3-hydroxyisobutyrate dehydrogenase [Limobrevibacterium gyesilva]